MRPSIPILLLTILFQQATIAQSPAFQTRYYTTESGLPSNGIKGMEWDESTGFLWFGTEAGIVRFNGIEFKTFTKENIPFIGSERISFLIRNNAGNIYAADPTGRVFRVNKNKILLDRVATLKNGVVDPSLYGLIVSDTFLTYKLAHPGHRAYPVLFTRTLVLSDTSMLAIVPEKIHLVSVTNRDPIELSFGSKMIKTGFKIGKQLYLVTNDDKVFLADVPTHSLFPVKIRSADASQNEFDTKGLRFFWENGYKDPIVIRNNRSWRLISRGANIIAEEICNVVPENVLIRYVQYSDENKVLFLGTDSKGLIVISRDRVELIKKKQADINAKNSYYSQIELPGNNVLTSEGDILGRAERQEQSVPVKGKLSFSVYSTHDSLLWFSRNLGGGDINCLHCYNYGTGQTIAYPKIPVANNFALTSSHNNFYVSNDNGLGLLQGDSLLYLSRIAPGKEITATSFDMMEFTPGVLTVASCNGLINYDISKHKSDTLLSLPGYCVRTLWRYKDYLFIGTYGKGYYVYGKGGLKAMPLDKNNFLLYTHCFVGDKYGYCWISTNRGLFKVSLDDIVNAYNNNVKKVYYHYIGRNDGMDITEMNGGCTPCALAMRDETLSFPTMDGLVWVQPKQFAPVLPDGEIFIDEIEADNKKINPDSLSGKSFPAQTQEIILRLGFSAWCNKENLYLEYQLNDTVNWRPINMDNDAALHLYNLNSGKYKLRIRKLNGFGSNNYSYKVVDFGISTPWYQQWWFYSLVGLIVIGVSMLFFKLRTRQFVIRQRKLEQQVFEKTKELQQKNAILEKNDTIKTRLISIISHDIITPLKFLTVAGKNLIQKKEVMSEELQQETLSEITNTSQELQLLSTNILNWIKYQNENRRLSKENFSVHELMNQVLGVLKSMAKHREIQLHNEVDKKIILYQYVEPLRILVYNLVSNAINFSEKGIITIASRRDPEVLVLIIKDEGIGMSPEQVHNIMSDQIIISSAKVDTRKGNGLGYLIIKDLIKMIGASIEIDSKKGSGTTVYINIPLLPVK